MTDPGPLAQVGMGSIIVVAFETRRPIIGDTLIPVGLFVRMLAGGVSEQEIRRECSRLNPRDSRAVLGYANDLPADPEERFHLLMHDAYWVFGNYTKALTGKGYWAHYQLRSVRKHGGLLAIKRYLSRRQPQEGFEHMRELNMVDLSIEALVLQPPWRSLFTGDELETARGRLLAAGYSPADPRGSG